MGSRLCPGLSVLRRSVGRGWSGGEGPLGGGDLCGVLLYLAPPALAWPQHQAHLFLLVLNLR